MDISNRAQANGRDRMSIPKEQEVTIAEGLGTVVNHGVSAAASPRSVLRWMITNLGRLGCLMFLSVAVIITFEVIMRFVFRNPTMWVTGMSSLLSIAGSFLLFAYTLQEKGHTRVDFIVAMLSRKSVFFLELFTSLLGLIYCGVLTWYGVKMVQSSILMEEVTQTLQIPLWIPQMFVPIGGGLMVLQLFKFLKEDLLKHREAIAADECSLKDVSPRAVAITVLFFAALVLSLALLKIEPRWGLLILFFALLFNGMPVSYAMGLFGAFGLFFLLGGPRPLFTFP